MILERRNRSTSEKKSAVHCGRTTTSKVSGATGPAVTCFLWLHMLVKCPKGEKNNRFALQVDVAVEDRFPLEVWVLRKASAEIYEVIACGQHCRLPHRWSLESMLESCSAVEGLCHLHLTQNAISGTRLELHLDPLDTLPALEAGDEATEEAS